MPDWKPSFVYGDNWSAARMRPLNNMPYYLYNLKKLPCINSLVPLSGGYFLTVTECHIRADMNDSDKAIKNTFHGTFHFLLIKQAESPDRPGSPVGTGEYHVYLKDDGTIKLDQARKLKWGMDHPDAKIAARRIIISSSIEEILNSFADMANTPRPPAPLVIQRIEAPPGMQAPPGIKAAVLNSGVLEETKTNSSPEKRPKTYKPKTYQELLADQAAEKARMRKKIEKENNADFSAAPPSKKPKPGTASKA